VSDRWERFGWYESRRKEPPPEHGIKVKKPGTTWWGQRWIEALERMSEGYANRLARGRTYARAGRTHDLTVAAGHVTAKVTGSRPTPYEVTMRLSKLSGAAWQKAIAAMAIKAQFAAELLAGQMPKEIDDAFRAGGVSIFPAKEADLVTECSCPDWANPCKHVAATHYVLGEALDRDPFLLFELRGRSKQQVLEALRAARSRSSQKPRGGRKTSARASPDEVEIPKVSLAKVTASAYERARATPPALHFSFATPQGHDALLRQLGAPSGWTGGESPADRLAPLVRAAAETARRMALQEPEDELPGAVPATDEAPAVTRRKPKRSTRKRRAR
jgi:uncharacterized Zn finger protein